MWNHSINVVAYLCFCLCVLTPLLLQRYSADFSSRADEANIPLSPVEPNFPGERVSVNGQFNTTTVLQIILIIKRLCLSWFKDILQFFLVWALFRFANLWKCRRCHKTSTRSRSKTWSRGGAERWEQICFTFPHLNIFIWFWETEQELKQMKIVCWFILYYSSSSCLRSVNPNKGSMACYSLY